MTFLHLFPPQSVEHILAIYLLMSIELFSGCLVSRHIFFLLLLLLRLSRHRFIHLLNISIVRNDDRVRHELNWVAKHPSLLPQTEPFLIRSSVIGRLIIQQMQRETSHSTVNRERRNRMAVLCPVADLADWNGYEVMCSPFVIPLSVVQTIATHVESE